MELIDKAALVAEIDSWRDKIIESISGIPLTGRDRADATFEYEILGEVKGNLHFFEVKEIGLEDSVKETLAQKYIDYTFKRHNINPESKEGQLIYYAYMHGMNQCIDELNKQLWNSTYQNPL